MYINFDGKYPFKKAFAMLEKELAGRGMGTDQVDGDIVSRSYGRHIFNQLVVVYNLIIERHSFQ